MGLVLGLALGVATVSGQVVISEFMASNGRTLADEDGDFPDWIELHNRGTTAVTLTGWFLSDNADNLEKWRFPAVTIEPRGFLVVFASGKNRALAGAPLHTDFSLSAPGEYLGLIQPDGMTVASAFAPRFPEQYRDLSYGIQQVIITNQLLAAGAPVRVRVPTDGSLGLAWTQRDFADAEWASGVTGVGHESEVSGFAVYNTKASILLTSLSAAKGVLANPSQQVGVVSETAATLNYANSTSDGRYGGNRPFPGQTVRLNVDDFVIEATAMVTLPSAGPWTFGVNSDEGFQLEVGSLELAFPDLRNAADTLGVFNAPAAGDYPLRIVCFDRSGGASLELFAAQGSHAAWDATTFRLVGDTVNGGLAARSAPVTGGAGGSLRPLIGADIEAAMKDVNASVYLRMPFTVAQPDTLESLTARMNYNDGFVAYLNGVEVARRNAPGTPQWDSSAPDTRPTQLSVLAEDINLTGQLALLTPGANLLAVHGLNHAASDPSFLILPQLLELQVESAHPGYFSEPTPGALNGPGIEGFAAAPRFSVERGFYDAPFDLELTSTTPEATIRYTTNGTAPTPGNGQVYTGPLPIGATTTLRAAAFRDQFLPSSDVTHTYLFLQDIVRQSPTGAPPPGWPASWGGNVVDYGMDPDVVNHASYAATIKDDLKTLPSFSIVLNLADLFDPTTGIYANPGQDGSDWERPCSLELIHPDGSEGFHVPAGIRIRGGFSRSTQNPKHAFRLFFREEYGATKLRYPLFGNEGTDTFDKLDLRTFQNYSWSFQGDSRGIFVRDQFNRDLQLAMGHQAERGEYYHLYINGQYWGLFNTCERPEASYGATYYGGQRENYDVIKVEAGPYTLNATDGDLDAWTRLYQLARAGFASDSAYELVQGNNPDGTRNPAYENLVDVPNLIDYMLIILYGGNLDAPISNFLGNTRPNNFYGVRDRTGPFGFRFFVHDAEHTLLNVNESRVGPYPAGDSSVVYSSPQWVWQKLQAHPEFRLRVADHAHRHFFNDGVLTPQRARDLFVRRTGQIDRAVVGESARWGDAKRAAPFTRTDWLSAVNGVLNTHLPQRGSIVLNQLRNAGLYPTVAAPAFNQHGGPVDPGFALTMNAPAGVIYYTLDGTDPRLRGGAVSPGARSYSGPVVLDETLEVKARTLSIGGVWSALNAASFVTIQTFAELFVTEIMYHPPDTDDLDGDQLEFLELKNVGTEELDLSGVRFDAGIQHVFPVGTRLAPGAFVVLVSDPAGFAARYPGVPFDGVYSGRLSNAGETLTLVHAVGTPFFSVRYRDAEPWPVSADGTGFSLVPVNPDVNPDPDDPANWRASSVAGGSPGRDDHPANMPAIWVNEVLTHTDPPLVDSIELHNPNPFAVDVGHWYLTDRRTEPRHYRIPAPRLIPAGGFTVFDERDFNPTPGAPTSFSLSSYGEEVYLYSGNAAGELTGYSHGFAFGAAANGVSFGRYLTSTGEAHYPAQSALSLDAANAGPRVGPVVISELHYQPLPGDAEFIELENLTSAVVPLYHPEHPTLGWRIGGIGYTFPAGAEMAPKGLLLVVSGDPAAFRARHNVGAQVPILGPFPGVLQDDGERLQLLRPDNPDVGDDGQPIVPEIVVDEVRYDNRPPWPTAAAGSGASLERLAAAFYGNDPGNWRSSPGPASPGLPNTGNRPPQVGIGGDRTLDTTAFPAVLSLEGAVTDDGLPNPPGRLTLTWSQVSGPGPVGFESPHTLSTTASLPGIGVYGLRLTAHDGALYSSSDLLVTVTRTTGPVILVPPGSVWRYWDQGSEPGTAWSEPGYDDSSWLAGPAKLGYGDGDEATVISFGPNASSKYVSSYFRRAFAVANPLSISDLKVGLRRDDGGIVYLNGTEVFRSNMPEGEITHTTPASNVVGGTDETTFYETAVDPSLLVTGANLLAVRVHQVNLSSSDLGLDLYLTGTAFPMNTAPSVSAGPGQSLVLPSLASLAAQVADDGLPIPPGQLSMSWSTTSGPGEIAFDPPHAARTTASFTLPGTYTLRITATDGALTAYDELLVQVEGDSYADWKARFFTPAELLDPTIAGDEADSDNDGHTNYQEYIAGTDPRDGASVLRILEAEVIHAPPVEVRLRFPAVAGRTYTLQVRTALNPGDWEDRLKLPAATEDAVVTVADPDASEPACRFYRIVTP